MSTIFLSYSRANTEFVNKLLVALRPVAARHGLEIFLDDLSILPGDRWEQGLMSALNEAQLLIAVVSAESMDSKWCGREWKRAAERGIPILPIELTATWVPDNHALAPYQFANKGEPLVVLGSWLDRVAAQILPKVDAKLAAVARSDGPPEPTDEPKAPAWKNLPLLADDAGAHAGGLPRTERWVALTAVAGGVEVAWRAERLGEVIWGRTASLDELWRALKAVGAPNLVQDLARDPRRLTDQALLDAGAAAFRWLLPDENVREVLGQETPLDRAVRLRVVNTVEGLRAFPWRLLADRQRWLVDGLWTIEESRAELDPIDVTITPSDRILVIAPDPDGDRRRGLPWIIERIRGFVETTLVNRGPEGPLESPDVFLYVARTAREVERAGPRAVVIVLGRVNVDDGGELSVAMEAGGGRRPMPLLDLTRRSDADGKLLYLDALDEREGQEGGPLPISAKLAAAWPTILARGVRASPRDHAEVLLGVVDNLFACGRDPLAATVHPRLVRSRDHSEARRGDAALSLVRVVTHLRAWRVNNAALTRHAETAEVNIDRTAQRSEAWNMVHDLAREAHWRSMHAVVLGNGAGERTRPDDRLDLVGGQIFAHVRRAFNREDVEDVRLLTLPIGRLPTTPYAMEQELVVSLTGGGGSLEDALGALADKHPEDRTLVLVDWGVVGPNAEPGYVSTLDSRALRSWLELSHRRIAPICNDLRDRVAMFHLLAVVGDGELRKRITGGLTTLVPVADRDPGVFARLLPEFSQVAEDDVDRWLLEHAPWAPKPYAAISRSIIRRTGGRFQDVIKVLADGLRFGFRADHQAGLRLIDDDSNTDW